MFLQIERVQNGALWKSYQLMKKQMEMKNKHQNNEKLLFHGTGPDSIDLIDKRGFNRSYAGAHGKNTSRINVSKYVENVFCLV